MDVGAEGELMGEEDEGGIRFTFKIPPGFASPTSPPSPSPIPRATTLKRFEGPAKDAKYSPSLSLGAGVTAYFIVNIYDGPRSSCLPQWIMKLASAPTFIPQPVMRARASSSM